MPDQKGSLQQNTLIRFIFVGSLNTLFGYGVFSLLTFCGVHYFLAMLFATMIGVLFSFKTLGKLVFNNADNRLFFKFILTYTIAYFLNILTLKTLLYFSINVYAAGAVSTAIAAVFSYLVNKKFVFKKDMSYEVN